MDTYNAIEAYYQKIRSGEEIAGEKIIAWYGYLIEGLRQRSFFFAPKKAAKAIRFIESFCHHHEGMLAPQLFRLELWQKALISVIFGIVDENNLRQFREVYIVTGRKNAKTLLASGIAEYMAYGDGEYGARVYFVAPKMKQAELCFNAFYQSVLKEPELAELTKKRRTDLYIEATNTSAEVLAFNSKKSDGLNPTLTVCDEISAWAGDAGLKQYEVLTSAIGARKQPLILSITTAGYGSDGIFDELMKRSTAILNGTSKEKRLAPFLYMIDDVDKWDDITELHKANPNLGKSLGVDYILDQIEIARNSLSKKAEFMTKFCNIKQNSSVAWLKTQDIEKCFGGAEKIEDFSGTYCVGGIDLSMSTDLTSACVVIEREGQLHVFSHFWLPEEKIEEATARDQLPYWKYVKRGLLTLSGGNIVDYKQVYQWFVDLVEKQHILPLQVGYDRYSSQYLIQDMKAYGFHCDDVIQGGNLTGVILETEAKFKDGAFQLGDNDLLKIHCADAALKIDINTNRRKLVKIRKDAHVDGMAALLDAMCMRAKWHSEIGDQLMNMGR